MGASHLQQFSQWEPKKRAEAGHESQLLTCGLAAAWPAWTQAFSPGLPSLTVGNHSLCWPSQCRRESLAVLGPRVPASWCCSLLKLSNLRGHLSGAGTLADTEKQQQPGIGLVWWYDYVSDVFLKFPWMALSSLVAQSCLPLCDPIDSSLPGSSCP